MYFPSQVWTLGDNVGRELWKSKVEREASQTVSVKREVAVWPRFPSRIPETKSPPGESTQLRDLEVGGRLATR